MNNISADKPMSDLRIAAMSPSPGILLKVIGPVLDRVLGVSKMRKLYLDNAFSGLDKQQFSSRLLEALGVKVNGIEDVIVQIPKTGRAIVVCNHPYGMIEGVIIAHLLYRHRQDTKIMANVGLKVFKEIRDYFIFANPLKPKSPINTSAIKQCFNHIEHEGLLVLFPAGRVSFYRPEKGCITDGDWNRLTVNLATKFDAPVLPLFISGTNSRLFHRMGRIYYRFRLLMLAREMFKLQQHQINLTTNGLIPAAQLKSLPSAEKMNDYIRARCYLNDPSYHEPWPEQDDLPDAQPIATPADKSLIKRELTQLPAKQHLLDFKSYSVYYGYQAQMPACVHEIARLREVTFRTMDEGSGNPIDGDKFDATYMHLLVFDHKNGEIIGAYRIGQTDLLQQNGGLSALYLSQMFAFKPEFINQREPCLEMGRSFIVQAHQNSFHGLLLLWKGIGAFVSQNPRYRTLYGTVSLSKLYDPRSVALINKIMVTQPDGVNARTAFDGKLHPEVSAFVEPEKNNIELLSTLVTAIEDDGKDIPVLLRQYHKLGAKFHCTGIDTNFNQTPGLLLSVDLPKAPAKLLKLYLGKARDEYLAWLG